MKNFETVIFVMQILLFTVRVHAGRKLGLIFRNFTESELQKIIQYNLVKDYNGGSVTIDNETMKQFKIYSKNKSRSPEEMMNIIKAKQSVFPIEIAVPINISFREFGTITNIEHNGDAAPWQFTFTWNKSRQIWQHVLVDGRYLGFLGAYNNQLELVGSSSVIADIKKLLVQPPGLLVEFADPEGQGIGRKYRFVFDESKIKAAVVGKYYHKYNKFNIDCSNVVRTFVI